MGDYRSEARNCRPTVRMSSHEKTEIQMRAAAAGVTFNEYVLARALDRPFQDPLRPGGPYPPQEEVLFDKTG